MIYDYLFIGDKKVIVDRKSLEINSENTPLSEEFKQICKDSAEQIISWTKYPPYSIFTASTRMFGFLNKKTECKQLVRKHLAESNENQDLKHAALIHFNFVDQLYSLETMVTRDDFHKVLVETMSDDRLTLEYANNLYISCHKDSYNIEPQKNRYAISRWAIPEIKSQQWQETVEIIRDIVSGKLDQQLRSLTLKEKIALLENAKTMPIFNEITSNFRFFGAGETTSVKLIDLQLNHLMPRLSENNLPKIGTANY
jgi:hypothetical protein